MGILRKYSPWEREYLEVWRQEQWFLRRYDKKPETVIDKTVAQYAPEKLMETLHAAFIKAFGVVFEKGTGVIIRAGRLPQRRQTFLAHQAAAGEEESRATLRTFSKAAGKAGAGNVFLSGAAGVGMGLMGATLPDVPLFTALLLKSVYETAESFGFPHEGERLYALRVIDAALSYGAELKEKNQALELYAQSGVWQDAPDIKVQMEMTARRLSETVLYGKILQNIPLLGAVGGAGDAVCMDRVRRYAEIKYHKRFLLRRKLEQELIAQ